MTTTILGLQCTLLLLIAAGAFGKRSGLLTEGFSDGLSKMLVNLALPCSVLAAFQGEMGEDLWSNSLEIFSVTVAAQVFYTLVGLVLYRRAEVSRRPVLQFAVLCPNSNFMGMPVIGGIFGDPGIVLLSVALVPARIFILSVGISFFVAGQSRSWPRRLLRSPALWAVGVGMAMAALRLTLPAFAEGALSSLGACTTPLSMLLIGCVLADLKPAMFRQASVWKFCALRLVLIPLAVLGGLKLFGIGGTVAGVAVIMSALPAGAMTVIFTQEYQKDEAFATACVISSTLLSVLTIPCINALCAAVF